jgi:hypothetical protein
MRISRIVFVCIDWSWIKRYNTIDIWVRFLSTRKECDSDERIHSKICCAPLVSSVHQPLQTSKLLHTNRRPIPTKLKTISLLSSKCWFVIILFIVCVWTGEGDNCGGWTLLWIRDTVLRSCLSRCDEMETSYFRRSSRTTSSRTIISNPSFQSLTLPLFGFNMNFLSSNISKYGLCSLWLGNDNIVSSSKPKHIIHDRLFRVFERFNLSRDTTFISIFRFRICECVSMF